jgi:MATE family multidrug resistance protein
MRYTRPMSRSRAWRAEAALVQAWRAEAGATLALAWPLAVTNLSQMAMVLTDMAFLGRLSTEALAAATLGGNLYYAVLSLLFGLSFAAAAMLARSRGARRHCVREMRRTVRQAMWAGLAVFPLVLAVMWWTEPLLIAMGQDPAAAAPAQDYARALVWGAAPFYGFMVLRGFLAALERPAPALVISLVAVLVNALLDWALIFGTPLTPGFGVSGAGAASSLGNLAMLLGLALWISRARATRRFRLAGRFWRADWPRFAELFRLGLPVAGMMALEIAVFSSAAIFVGWFGAIALAAHAIAIQAASATFMVPMGIGQAATARVGLFAGAGDTAGARRAGFVAIALGAAFMSASAAMFMLFPAMIARAFLDPTLPGAVEAMALAVPLLIVAGVFQLADGVQTCAAGALRGLADTAAPMWIAAGGYWGAGLPVGLLLALPLGMGPLGIWIGLALGLVVVAALLTARWVVRARRAPPALHQASGPLPV